METLGRVQGMEERDTRIEILVLKVVLPGPPDHWVSMNHLAFELLAASCFHCIVWKPPKRLPKPSLIRYQD